MRNPLRDEGAAFHLVFVAIGAFALIAVGSWISTWLGVAVTIALVGLGVGVVWRTRQGARRDLGLIRILVVGARTTGDAVLEEEIRRIAGGRPYATHTTELGGSDPGTAVEDALRDFPADAIVVTGSVGADVVERLRGRFVVPVTQPG